MSLFSKKKEQTTQMRKVDLPNLPDFPDIQEDQNEIPSYESTLEAIKKEVGSDMDIPLRESSKERMLPSVEPEFKPVIQPAPRQTPLMSSGEEKPVFVKLDNYKEALSHLSELKRKIEEAEMLFDQLDHIRSDESTKLESWKQNIQSVKEKLLTIDRSLFEA